VSSLCFGVVTMRLSAHSREIKRSCVIEHKLHCDQVHSQTVVLKLLLCRVYFYFFSSLLLLFDSVLFLFIFISVLYHFHSNLFFFFVFFFFFRVCF
jgi:hypothetical protein